MKILNFHSLHLYLSIVRPVILQLPSDKCINEGQYFPILLITSFFKLRHAYKFKCVKLDEVERINLQTLSLDTHNTQHKQETRMKTIAYLTVTGLALVQGAHIRGDANTDNTYMTEGGADTTGGSLC